MSSAKRNTEAAQPQNDDMKFWVVKGSRLLVEQDGIWRQAAAAPLKTLADVKRASAASKPEEITREELEQLSDSGDDFETFPSELAAKDYADRQARFIVMRGIQIKRAKAKVERERAEFRKNNPGLAAKLTRQSEIALEDAAESVRKAKLEQQQRDAKHLAEGNAQLEGAKRVAAATVESLSK